MKKKKKKKESENNKTKDLKKEKEKNNRNNKNKEKWNAGSTRYKVSTKRQKSARVNDISTVGAQNQLKICVVSSSWL